MSPARNTVAALLGGYAFVFGFLRRVNEWYNVFRLGKMQHPLPSGNLGWPFLENMLPFLKAFKSDTDSFIYNHVSRSLFLSPLLSPTGTKEVDEAAAVSDQKKKINDTKTKMRKDMTDLLMEVKDEDGRQLEDEDIIALILVFLLAGHESSAHGILWTIIYFMEHPHVFQKAKKEQGEIMETRPSTQKGLNLKELSKWDIFQRYAVIDVMLRITSILFVNFRQAKVDVNINGYTIPKGWKVLVWSREVHMDPEIYHNPKEYDPSRWEVSMNPT
ncbi:Beta-amyrin 11-oxidase [Spatholobus suberectus]|nr:Beta-amyrin 11-oxidase [Spatholobus suberectus]